MPPGKLAAQAAHVSAQALISYLSLNPEDLFHFKELGTSGSRIVLKAKNLLQLQKAFQHAETLGLPAVLFSDSGHILPPDFDGSPVITGLGIGPASRADMRPVVKKFQCM